MQANSWRHKLFSSHLSFSIWKMRNRKEKSQKFDYIEDEKSFLDERKNIFYSFNIKNNTRSFIFSKSCIYLFIKVNKFSLELHLASSGS